MMTEIMEIIHVQTGTKWVSEEGSGSIKAHWAKMTIKDHIAHLSYIETADGTILPGEFVRNHCVISFRQGN